MFRSKALLWESIILLLPSPTCKAYPIAILLHDHCAICALPPTALLYAIYHTQYGDGNEQALVSLKIKHTIDAKVC